MFLVVFHNFDLEVLLLAGHELEGGEVGVVRVVLPHVVAALGCKYMNHYH